MQVLVPARAGPGTLLGEAEGKYFRFWHLIQWASHRRRSKTFRGIHASCVWRDHDICSWARRVGRRGVRRFPIIPWAKPVAPRRHL